jgi:hypothetical protein
MPTLLAQAAGPVEAPASLVLEIIRDFDGHHRHILPSIFSDFRVLAGGVGAGTVTAFTTTLGGRSTRGQTVATEPAPGVVQEDVVGRDMVTFFRVQERGDGASYASITTTWTPSGGLDGMLERLFAPRMLTKAYEEEIRLLQAYAKVLAAERAGAAAEVEGGEPGVERDLVAAS